MGVGNGENRAARRARIFLHRLRRRVGGVLGGAFNGTRRVRDVAQGDVAAGRALARQQTGRRSGSAIFNLLFYNKKYFKKSIHKYPGNDVFLLVFG